jgi:hypothetical protein
MGMPVFARGQRFLAASNHFVFAAACRFNDRAGDAGGKIYPGGFNL